MYNVKLAFVGSALAGALAFGGAPAKANIVWDLSSATGDLGPSQGYVSGGFTITATGWDYSGGFPAAPTDLYGKQEPAPDEKGLGIANDPTGDHEIWDHALMQIDVSQPYAAGLNHYQFEMGSSTNGEMWSVWGSDVPASDPNFPSSSAVLYSNQSDQLTIYDLSGYKYYEFLYTGPNDPFGNPSVSNVLLYKTFTAIVPEPSSWALMGLGFAGLAFAGYRRTKASALAV